MMSRRLWPLLAFALLQCRGAFVANVAVSQRRATTPALAAAQICMKKGRAQGGGPKIGLGRKSKTAKELNVAKKRREIERSYVRIVKKPTVLPGRQEDRFADQASPTTPAATVYARTASGASEDGTVGAWMEVGRVSVAGRVATLGLDSPLSHEDAAFVQKRLILEHACRIHPTLQLHHEHLELGMTPPRAARAAAEGDAMADVEPEPEPTLLQRDEIADLIMEQKQLAAACGFVGKPDPKAGHFYADSELGDAFKTDARKVILSKLGNNAKSAVHKQFNEMLGLRGH